MEINDEETKEYRCFIRDWWIDNPKWPNGLEPCAGPKDYLKGTYTYQEARALCKEHAEENDPGRYSRKMEFEEA